MGSANMNSVQVITVDSTKTKLSLLQQWPNLYLHVCIHKFHVFLKTSETFEDLLEVLNQKFSWRKIKRQARDSEAADLWFSDVCFLSNDHTQISTNTNSFSAVSTAGTKSVFKLQSVLHLQHSITYNNSKLKTRAKLQLFIFTGRKCQLLYNCSFKVTDSVTVKCIFYRDTLHVHKVDYRLSFLLQPTSEVTHLQLL